MNKQYIYFEGDEINSIYFLESGNAGYVLPRHQNLMFIQLNPGLNFGISCIVGSFMEEDGPKFDVDTWPKYRDKLQRQFTIQC